MDYKSEPDKCEWEPHGNGHHYTKCGKLIFDRKFSPSRDRRCMICDKPFTDATYRNKHEVPPKT